MRPRLLMSQILYKARMNFWRKPEIREFCKRLNTFVFSQGQAIQTYYNSFIGSLLHFFGKTIWLSIQDQQGKKSRIYVPLSEVRRLCPALSGQTTHGIGIAFARAIGKVQQEQPRTLVQQEQPRTPSEQHSTTAEACIDNGDNTKREVEVNLARWSSPQILGVWALSKDSGEPIGGVEFHCRLAKENTYGTEKGLRDDSYYPSERSGKEQGVRIMWVKRIYTNEMARGKGFGRLLMQAVMEHAHSQQCEGRIALDSHGASPGFYYKLGMRSPDENVNNLIRENLSKPESRLVGDREFVHYYMYMPAESIESWKKRIAANRLFKDLGASS